MESSQLVSPSSAVKISKCLLGAFVGGVTLWYLATPYIVKPHHQFKLDYDKYVMERSESGQKRNLVENWTKWRLYLGSENENFTVHSLQHLSLENKYGEYAAVFEWRQQYKSVLQSAEGGLEVEHEMPWYSSLGLYNHFYTEATEAGGIRFMPRFMFGVPTAVLDELYGGADGLPIIGLTSENTQTDRIILQCVMNLVTLAVIFLLYINNPPQGQKSEKEE